ncbi:MAG TPA: ATP-binding cassette domain-containing protein [Acidimicrobiales bacterium]|nr:ATP-binding cassette domain-containing protein [Acidimicrobiales bacterium]
MKGNPGGAGVMIRFDGVHKEYADGTVAVNELSFDVTEGELCVLVGPSGCGKTTTMRLVNRLTEPTRGSVHLDGQDVGGIDAVQLRRRIGYVIQQGGLFPHRTVADNVGTVPSLLGWDRQRIRSRVGELLELVGLDPARHARRYPHELSGGQRQRVGVARALGADPVVLLMDEPFSAVDPVARNRLQVEFLRLQAEVGKTVLFVTHDIDEAIRLGDRVAVFSQGGKLEQLDTPAAVLGSPASAFVADFVGADRGVKRLDVTPIDLSDLDAVNPAGSAANPGSGVGPPSWPAPSVPASGTLGAAMAAILSADSGRVSVTDVNGVLLGSLDADGVHRQLRRSVRDGAASSPPGPPPS